MSPERSNVGVVLRDKGTKDLAGKFLERSGHNVVFNAEEFPETTDEIEMTISRMNELGVKVLVAPLTNPDGNSDYSANKFVKELQERSDAQIIDLSLDEIPSEEAVYLNQYNISELGKKVSELPPISSKIKE